MKEKNKKKYLLGQNKRRSLDSIEESTEVKDLKIPKTIGSPGHSVGERNKLRVVLGQTNKEFENSKNQRGLRKSQELSRNFLNKKEDSNKDTMPTDMGETQFSNFFNPENSSNPKQHLKISLSD